jgi:Sugar (and other) transporter
MTLYFDFINRHYWYFSVIGLIFTIIGSIAAFLYMPESPLWAIKVGQTEKAKAIILRIMKENNVDCSEEIDNLDKVDNRSQ